MKNSPENLHDRATRGEQLSEEEEQKLEAWYAEMDRQRMQALFGQDETPSFEEMEKRITLLQLNIDKLVAQIASNSALLQQMVEQNRMLRLENTALLKQLTNQLEPELV